MSLWHQKRKITNSLRRERTGHNRKGDPEETIGNSKYTCKFCGRLMYAYKEDIAGNVIMACPFYACRGSAEMMDSPTNRIDKLWIHQMNNDLKDRQWIDDFGRFK